MAITTFTSGQILTAAQMNAVQANDYNQTVSTKTASYTLVAADKGTRVVMNSASATTITVNTSLFSAGDTLILQNISTGVCTLTAGTATVSSAGSLAIPQNGSGLLYFTSAGVSIFYPSAVTTTASGVVQVKNAFKADAFSTASATYVDVTDLSISITPTSATNKVLVIMTVQGSQVTGDGGFQLMRGATAIGVSTVGSTFNGAGQVSSSYGNAMFTVALAFLDSPATTSATTYKVQAIASGGTTYVNRRGASTAFGGSSSITVMEVLP